MPRTLIIAEVGVNHNGDIALAEKIVRAAKDAGADVAKFHSYRTEDVMTRETPLAAYMKQGDASFGNFFDMAKKYELSNDTEARLQAFAASIGLEFLSSPFDVPSVGALKALGVRRLKIPSGELVNPFLLEAVAATGLPLIVSTGMATLDEVRWAVDFLAARHSGPVTLLHCLSQYPAEFRHVNLNAVTTLKREFPQLPVGYSDHTPGIEAAVAAVALGATVIEKHLTLDKSLPGPDQKASLEPSEFAAMVKAIRNIELAMGDGVKIPTEPELKNLQIVRKSLVSSTALLAGHAIALVDLVAKRPGNGIPARQAAELLGRKLRHDVPADHLFSWGDFI